MHEHVVRPNKWYYLIVPLGFILGGVVIDLVFTYLLVLRWDDYAQKYIFPGSHEIELHGRIGYSVFYEYEQSNEGNQDQFPETVPNFSITSVSANGEEVPIRFTPEASRMVLGNRTIRMIERGQRFPKNGSTLVQSS